MLGRDVVAVFSHSPSRSVFTADSRGGYAVDITDRDSMARLLDECAPDVVINCAAYTDVDGAEAYAGEAWRVNADGAGIVAEACARSGAALCHLSTDFVFDGEKGAPYNEGDTPHPVNVYGASKLAGERAVLRAGPCWLIRAQWMFGAGGRNFAATMLRLAGERETWGVVDDQCGVPSYTRDVAEALLDVVEHCPAGIYHVNNDGAATWHEFAQAVLEGAGLDPGRILPIASRDYPSPARRPRDSRLDRRALRLQGRGAARPWREALADYLEEIGARGGA